MLKERILAFLMAAIVVCGFASCGDRDASSAGKESVWTQSSSVEEAFGSSSLPTLPQNPSPSPTPKVSPTITPAVSTAASSVGETVLRIDVGGEVFYADLRDTETAKALCEMLPMSLEMTDWEKTAKRFDLPSVLPEEVEELSSIQVGELVLEGSGSLCLFYQEDSQGGNYTPIAVVREPENLSKILGGERVEVTFQLVTE